MRKNTHNDSNGLSMHSLLQALLRENYILKSQLASLRIHLIDEGILDQDESDRRLFEFVANLDEKEYTQYIIETAQHFDGEKSETIKN